jgi:hypothetical protein
MNISQIPQELLSLLIGASGGIAGYFVSEGVGWRLFVASAFVGGFAAYTIPPILAAILIYITGTDVMGGLMNESRGVIGAVSWQLILSLKNGVPEFFDKLKERISGRSNTKNRNQE